MEIMDHAFCWRLSVKNRFGISVLRIPKHKPWVRYLLATSCCLELSDVTNTAWKSTTFCFSPNFPNLNSRNNVAASPLFSGLAQTTTSFNRKRIRMEGINLATAGLHACCMSPKPLSYRSELTSFNKSHFVLGTLPTKRRYITF
jgi:hypothetical protein